MGEMWCPGQAWGQQAGVTAGVLAEHGGFHACLKTTEGLGIIYGGPLVAPVVWDGGEGIRPSEGRINYFLKPGDPVHPQHQYKSWAAAFVFVGQESFLADHGREPSESELDLYFLARAQRCPLFDLHLHLMRY